MATKTKNIGGTDKDAFYRYKRPELKTKVEKPGTNGVKTVIENIGAIAKALKVPPEYPTRFLGYELCTQATFEDSTDRTCTIVKGKHTEKELDKALDEFIKKFVLCPTCKLPETRISVKKGQVRIKCASCGHAGPLTTGHRLENYIAKNPPNQTKESKAKGTGKDPKKTKGKDDSSDEEPSQPADGKEKPVEKQKEEIEKEDWSLDTSIEAQKARRAEFLAAQLVKTNRTSGAGEEGESGENTKPETILKNFIKDNSDGVAIAAELDRLQLKHGLSPEERYRILLTAAIDLSQPKTLGAQFTKRAPLFKKAVKGKAAGVLFITSIERLLDSGSIPHGGSTQEAETRGKSQEDLKTNLVSRIALVLQKLYEGDVLEEDAILTWAQSPPEVSAWAVGRDVASYARKSAKPFIDWLQSAEEDED